MRNFRVIAISIFSAVLIIVSLSGLTSCTSVNRKEANLIELVRSGKADELKLKFDKDSITSKDENGFGLLHIAVMRNEPIIVQFLLNMGANIEEVDRSGKTPLMLSLTHGYTEITKVLVAYNANIFSRDFHSETPFSYALKNGVCEQIITPQTVYHRDVNARTALHYAVDSLSVPLVKLILSMGNPVSHKDTDGKTPLMLAYSHPEKEEAATIAAELLLAGTPPLHENFAEFETAVLKRNYAMRFEDGRTVLHIMARGGHIGFIKFLVSKKVQIDAKDIASATPLHEAVKSGKIAASILLLNNGANPNAQDSSGNAALHFVVPAASRSKLLDELLAKGAKPNIKDNYGETPLHIAARVGMNEDIIGKLVEAGADVNERNKKGQTPLLLAVEKEKLVQAGILVSLGSDIHAEDIDGETAYTKALHNGFPMIKSVVFENNCSQRDSNGLTPLHIAVKNNVSADILHYLLEIKSSVNTRDKNGNTPLHVAVEKNNREIGAILLANNADIFYTNVYGNSPLKYALTKGAGREDWMITSATITAKDGAGNTPLHFAAEWGIVPMMFYMIDRGANINQKNENGETPIFNAVRSNNPGAIQALLSVKKPVTVNINERDFLGNSVLHSAVRWSAYNSAKMILEMPSLGSTMLNSQNLAGKTPLHEAARQGDINFVQMFTLHRADVNALDEMGRTPLVDAILTGKRHIIGLLLQNGASPVQQDMYGMTALHEAARIGDYEVVSMLRNAGGNPLARDTYGTTPFLLSLKKDIKVIDAVLGDEKFLADSDGSTPLHIAVSENASTNIIEYLVKKKFPINKRNRNGETALLLAVKGSQPENAYILFAEGADPFITNNQGICAVSEILKTKTDFVPMAADFSLGKTDSQGDGILHYAARGCSIETLKRLLKMPGMSLSAKNTAGETPYDVAVRWECNEIAAMLRQ